MTGSPMELRKNAIGMGAKGAEIAEAVDGLGPALLDINKSRRQSQ